MLQPEIRAIQAKYKGNRQKISEETMRLYKERGVSLGVGLPAGVAAARSCCCRSTRSSARASPRRTSARRCSSWAIPVLQDFTCQAPGTLQPCIDPTFRGWATSTRTCRRRSCSRLPIVDFRGQLLAIIAAVLQLIQTRMMTPTTTDPQARAQQRIFLILPLFSIIYGSFLPAGLFIYWIVFTAVLDRAAIPDHRLGRAVPAVRLDPGLRPEPPAAIPGHLRAADSRRHHRRSKRRQPPAEPAQPQRQLTARQAPSGRPPRGRTSRRGRRR